MERKNRDFSLDLMKALAIFMVCETHYLHLNESWLDNLWGITTNMGVPLFFMVNGALLFSKKMNVQKHYLKTLRVFVMCVVWKLLSVIVVSMAKHISPFQNGQSSFVNFLLGYNDLGGYELGHFWFLYALVGIYIIFPIFKLSLEQKEGKYAVKMIYLLCFAFTFGLTSLNVLKEMIGWGIDKAINVDFNALNVYNLFGQYCYCLVWFMTGGFIYTATNDTNSEFEKKKYTDIPDTVLFFLFFLGWGLLFGVNRYQNVVGSANGIVIYGYYIIPTFIMTTSFFAFTIRHFQHTGNRFIESISKNSFSIYMLHMLVGLGFLKIQQVYWFSPGIPLNTVKAIYMLLGSWGIALILHKVPLIRKLFEF